MLRRPSLVRMRKCSMRRKTYRYCCEFFFFTLLLLLLGLSFAGAVLWGILLILPVELLLIRRY